MCVPSEGFAGTAGADEESISPPSFISQVYGLLLPLILLHTNDPTRRGEWRQRARRWKRIPWQLAPLIT
jgi:hypothetical protein